MSHSRIAFHSSRATGFAIALALQLLFIWALQGGFVQRAVEVAESIQVTLLAEIPRVKEELPPIRPAFTSPPLPEVIVPEIVIETPTEQPEMAAVSAAPNPAPQQSNSQTGMVLPRPDPRRPWARPTFDQPGSVVLRLTVNEKGKIIGARVEQSSGKRYLDAATIRVALQSWWVLPGTVNGKPVTMELPWKVNFHVPTGQVEAKESERPAPARLATSSGGSQRNCLLENQIDNMQVIDGRTMVARMKSNTYKRLDLSSCPGLASTGRVAHDSSTGELCALDSVLIGPAASTPCTIDNIANIEYAEAAALYSERIARRTDGASQ